MLRRSIIVVSVAVLVLLASSAEVSLADTDGISVAECTCGAPIPPDAFVPNSDTWGLPWDPPPFYDPGSFIQFIGTLFGN